MTGASSAENAAYAEYSAARTDALTAEFRSLARDDRARQWSDDEILRHLGGYRAQFAAAAFLGAPLDGAPAGAADVRSSARTLVIGAAAVAAPHRQRAVTRRETAEEDYADLRATLRLLVKRRGIPGPRKTADFLRTTLSVVNAARARSGESAIRLRTARRVWHSMQPIS